MTTTTRTIHMSGSRTATVVALRTALIVPLVLGAACKTATVRDENTLNRLDQVDIVHESAAAGLPH